MDGQEYEQQRTRKDTQRIALVYENAVFPSSISVAFVVNLRFLFLWGWGEYKITNTSDDQIQRRPLTSRGQQMISSAKGPMHSKRMQQQTIDQRPQYLFFTNCCELLRIRCCWWTSIGSIGTGSAKMGCKTGCALIGCALTGCAIAGGICVGISMSIIWPPAIPGGTIAEYTPPSGLRKSKASPGVRPWGI